MEIKFQIYLWTKLN